MEFNEKLQELRKKSGLTQEEAAEMLFVSRTAVSKWESGRGYPNIDSLKAIAKLYNVTIDELLSSDELLTIAEEDTKEKESHSRDLLYGLLDMSFIMLFFLPFFAERSGDVIREVSLLELTAASLFIKASFISLVSVISLYGVFTLAMQNCRHLLWIKSKTTVSLILNSLATILFTLTLNPYSATFTFLFLAIKAIMLIKKH